MMNRYLVPLKYLVNLNSHLNFKFEGKIKFITVTKWQQHATAGNTKGGSITVRLTSCLTGLESAV